MSIFMWVVLIWISGFMIGMYGVKILLGRVLLRIIKQYPFDTINTNSDITIGYLITNHTILELIDILNKTVSDAPWYNFIFPNSIKIKNTEFNQLKLDKTINCVVGIISGRNNHDIGEDTPDPAYNEHSNLN